MHTHPHTKRTYTRLHRRCSGRAYKLCPDADADPDPDPDPDPGPYPGPGPELDLEPDPKLGLRGRC